MATTPFSSSIYVLIFLAILQGFVMPYCAAAPNNVMYSGDTLYAGQSLEDGNYVFIIQNDCNLVLYDNKKFVWASGTGGQGTNCRLVMQHDANLVVYNGNNGVVWNSNTGRDQGNYVLILQRDRNVVIYGKPIASTGTNIYGAPNAITIKNTIKLP